MTNPFVRLKFGWVSLLMMFTLISLQAQTFYQSYPEDKNNAVYKAFETNTGYELFLRENATNGNWIILSTDANGNQTNRQVTNIPISTESARPLADGTLLYANLDGDQITYTHYTRDAQLLHQFNVTLPSNINRYESGNWTQLNDGTLTIMNAYTDEEYNGDATDKNIIVTHYDLANQQLISQQEIIRTNNSFSFGVMQMVPASDGNVFALFFQSDPIQRRTICKYQPDGTEIWCQQVSTLERPASILSATPDGGLWFELPTFEITSQLDGDGNYQSQNVKNALQNQIVGPVDIRGVIASDTDYLLLTRACPTGGDCEFMTAKIGLDGTILQTNFTGIIADQIPDNLSGMILSDGGYLVSGDLNYGGNRTPVMLRLDENGLFDDADQLIDLELLIDGSIANPTIYSSHTITLIVENNSTATATDVVVNIPQAAGDVYSGANPYDATQGTFNYWSTFEWTVGDIAAGGSEEIIINYFKTTESVFSQYAQIIGYNETDLDSSPNNGDGLTPMEDDEIIYGVGPIDLSPLLFQSNKEYAVAVDDAINDIFYYFNINQQGTPIDYILTNALYISTDNELSDDDIIIGFDFGSIGDGTPNKFDSFIDSSIPPGFYYLLIKLDYTEEIEETDETNNVIQYSSIPKLLITGVKNNQPDLVAGYLRGSSSTVQAGNSTGSGYVMYNTGENSDTHFLLKYYLSTDQTLDGNDILGGEYQFNSTFVLDETPQSLSASITVPSNTPSGNYYTIIEVDANNVVIESHENNNIRVSQNQIQVIGTNDPCNPDTQAPVINNCPDNITVTTPYAAALVNWTAPTASDNCDNSVTLLSTNDPGDSFGLGSVTVYYTATDDFDNESECTFVVTVLEDNNNTCVNNILENSGYENSSNSYSYWSSVGDNNFSISNDAYEGNNALKISGSQSGGILQNLPAQAGETYAVKVWIKQPTNGGYLKIKFLTSNWQPIYQQTRSVANNNTYVLYDLTETAPSGTAYVEVSVLKSGTVTHDILIDNWCLTTDTNIDPCNPDNEDPVFTSCPSNINVTTSTNTAVANWSTPTATDNCDNSLEILGSDQSGDEFELGTHEVVYNAFDEANNSATCVFVINVTPEGGNTCVINLFDNPDFEDGLTEWNNLGDGSITNDAFSGANALRICNGRVIQSIPVIAGQEYFLEFAGKNESGIPLLNTGSVQIKFLTNTWQPITPLTSISVPSQWLIINSVYTAPANAAYLEVSVSGSQQTCIVVDDFCVSTGGQSGDQADLTLSDLQGLGIGEVGAIVDFTFDLNNIGQATATGSYTIRSYLSSNSTLDANDVEVGIVPTGNTPVGTIENVPASITVPAGLAAGNYYLIYSIDDDNVITESNENNNLVTQSFMVTTDGGSNTPLPCDLNYTIENGTLTISGNGLNAGHVIVKLFTPSWQTHFECLDNCGGPIIINGIGNGTYHLSVDLYNSSWQPTCDFLEDVHDPNRSAVEPGEIVLDQHRGIVLKQVFPIPASNLINIEISAKEASELPAQLYDSQGRIVMAKPIELLEGTNRVKWDISELPSGFYQILFNTGHRHTPIRFIKQRL